MNPTNPNSPSAPQHSFEESLRTLEETVELLEAGALPLEESLVLFEKGVGSLKRCHAVLDQAEKRVRLLVKSVNGSAVLEDIAPVPSSGSSSGSSSALTASASGRKKSPKQSIDLERPTRQNAAPLTDTPLSSPSEHPADPEGSEKSGERVTGKPTQTSSPDDSGLGGSLFGGSK